MILLKLIRKIFYGIRGIVIRNMIMISLPPLTVTAVILILFTSNYSNKSTESSLKRVVEYAEAMNELGIDELHAITILQDLSVKDEINLFIIDENGQYIYHPKRTGDVDQSLLSTVKKGEPFFSYITSDSDEEYFVYQEYISEKRRYIGAEVPESKNYTLLTSFIYIILILIIIAPFIILTISVFIAKKINERLNWIIATASQVSHGDLTKFIMQPHYRKCVDILNCNKTNCPSYYTSNLACWGIENTLCYEMNGCEEDISIEEKIETYCKNCKVYRRSIKSEFDELIDSINTMIVTTQNVVASIKDISTELSVESEELTSTDEQLTIQLQNQASFIEETTSSNKELAVSINSIAEATKNQANKVETTIKAMDILKKSSSEVSTKVNDANIKIENTVTSTNETKAILDNTTAKMMQISENSQKIVDIVQIINDISDQINLLSLNASIEAARAGEHGRGFAIVAQEISKLADATAASTKEIETTINQTRDDVTEGVNLVQTTNEEIMHVMDNIKNTDLLMKEIAASAEEQRKNNQIIIDDIDTINQMSTLIAKTTAEQKVNSDKIINALTTINDSIKIISTSSGNLHNSADELKQKSYKLREITDYFKVKSKAT